MNIYFNELSIISLTPNIVVGRKLLYNLIDTYKQINDKTSSIVRIENGFFTKNVADNFSINDWIVDVNTKRTYRDILLDRFKYPYIEDNDEDIANKYISESFTYSKNKTPVIGLALAYLNNTMCISLLTSPNWEDCSLIINNIVEPDTNIFVRNASKPEHVECHIDWLNELQPINLVETNDLPERKKIKLRDDHGQDTLEKFSRKLLKSKYVIGIINSLPYNSHETKFIKEVKESGIIEIVLTGSDKGIGVVVQTTGRNLRETKRISEIIEIDYRDKQ